MPTHPSGPLTPPRADGGSPAGDAGGADRTVMVVDDEEAFARSVALWLDEYWTTVVATDGREAVDRFGPDVDAVLLDRKMPGLSGRETLERIRDQEGAARVAMLTALEPDWDIVDMDFDMYLTKPVERREVVEATRELLERADYTRELQVLYSLSSKVAKLRSRYSEEELRDDERFQKLQAELDRVREQARDQVADLDQGDVGELMQVVEDA